PQNQILAAPIDGLDELAAELRSHLCGIDRSREPRVEDLHVLEPPADQPRFQACSYSLDLRQFWHSRASVPAWVGPARSCEGPAPPGPSARDNVKDAAALGGRLVA